MTVRWLIAVLSTALLVPSIAAADDEIPLLRHALSEFLANAGEREAHERFWADDLVYTSSDGSRTTKAAILAGFDDAADTPEPATRYRGEDIDIRRYGDTAVVAFRLIATDSISGQRLQTYFNTGTFVKRGGVWRAVAWQATRIPTEPTDE